MNQPLGVLTRMRAFQVVMITLSVVILFSACSAKEKITKKRKGDQEIVTVKEGKKTTAKIIYHYKNDKPVLGEYWLRKGKDDKKSKKKKGNILNGTKVAKKYAKVLRSKGVKAKYNPNVGKIEGKFKLNFIQKVDYTRKGLPSVVKRRGYSDIPLLGRFYIKTNIRYRYNRQGQLTRILQKNLNVDTFLLNVGIGNVTKINYDRFDRPSRVYKGIGSIPPTAEVTEYSYRGDSPYLQKTVYNKVGLDGIKPKRTERIEIWYQAKTPWNGLKKYNFGKSVAGLRVYDFGKGKYKYNFKDMPHPTKQPIKFGLFMKDIYDLVQNEKQGPQWRMGDLPDTPIPFADGRVKKDFGDYAWYY